jgi:hypothetical protein
VKVWVYGWQFECCGEDFAVGSQVELDLLPISHAEQLFLGEMLPADAVAGIAHVEEHHGSPDDRRPVVTRGRVTRIDGAWWASAPRPGEKGPLYPLPGSGVLRSVERVPYSNLSERYDPDDPNELTLAGYVVELTPLDAESSRAPERVGPQDEA